MDAEYDKKFAEMKKYIPFLESMIRRLESTNTSSSSSNPRQAQLDKIRSLRDLLLDKKKRMKMVNLLKCEQVLVNLYAKVEQKDTLPNISNPVPVSRNDLDSVRNKLKSLNTTDSLPVETLPEIARASEIEAICTPGSKEPALFQRRPNLESATSVTPAKTLVKSPDKIKSNSRRSYTRVLVSPEPSERRWSASKDNSSDKHLFSRRSPRQSPRRHSPFYRKKEKKKNSKEKETRKQKDLNITLNVPQERLDSLNTDDILSRIINCSDNDVDITTLRELRSQILGELQKTGASDDISDLILKSYKQKKRDVTKQEVEEGELSDSESEAIESVYGNLKILETGIAQSDTSSVNKSHANENDSAQRKIQICLVFNSGNDAKKSDVPYDTEHETFHEVTIGDTKSIKTSELSNKDIEKNLSQVEVTKENSSMNTALSEKFNDRGIIDKAEEGIQSTINLTDTDQSETPSNSTGFRANFYKPLNEDNIVPDIKRRAESPPLKNKLDGNIPKLNQNMETETKEQCPSKSFKELNSKPAKNNDSRKESSILQEEIPLLGKDSRTVEMTSNLTEKSAENVSEIDILQALKNEILGENVAIPRIDDTPTLHQPKLVKVSNAQEVSKKRISIENYKAKSSNVSSAVNPLFKKSSLNLTEKEYERFNFSKIALADSSDEEVQNTDITLEDVYGDFAPKSPENNDRNIGLTSPVIIPDEPISDKIINIQSDVDMRKLPLLPITTMLNSPVTEIPKNTSLVQAQERKQLSVDPRMRKEIQRSMSKESPNPYSLNSERNRSIATNPNYHGTPSMTPSRTPLHQTFEIDVPLQKNHVYAPLLPNTDNNREISDMDFRRRAHWETMKNDSSDFRRSSLDTSSPSGVFSRSDCPLTPNPSFGRSEKPMTPLHQFGRSEMPMTPSHQFGRSEIPMTPTHPFGHDDIAMNHPYGRSEIPRTPSHQFGRGEMPMTPNHPFGRGEMPMTPSHPFGRSDVPMTPRRNEMPISQNHPYSRNEMPMTPSHPFGRNEVHGQYFSRNDPRINRSEQESSRNCDDKIYSRERNVDCEKEYDRFSKSKARTDGGYQPDISRGDRFRREKSVGRNEKLHQYDSGGDYNRLNRGTSIGRHESDLCEPRGRQYQREYGKDRYNTGCHTDDSFTSSDRHDRDVSKLNDRQMHRERSIGRNTSYEESRFHQVSNVERNYGDQQSKGNKLSIEPKTGRSFVIDTSISNTFQNKLESKKNTTNMFDERRRRAASVGRASTSVEQNENNMTDFNHRRQRASSVGRALRQNNVFIENTLQHIDIKKDFRRCSSVGRDLQSNKSNKSFQDIKAEFELYQMQDGTKNRQLHNSRKRQNERDARTKETLYKANQMSHNSSTTYSPRRNYRDPRMRREHLLHDKKNKFDRYRKDYSYVKKPSGIVYSNDNIAKGAILGSGYGVKNYKIPKIKRPVVNLEPIVDSAVENTDKNGGKTKHNIANERKEAAKTKKISDASKPLQDDKTKKIKTNEKQNEINEVQKEVETISENIDKQAKQDTKPKNTESPRRSRRNKKGVIYDSDSEADQKESKLHEENKAKDAKEQNEEEVLLNNAEALDSSFGIEDLDILGDNMVADSNISAILADLDDDISANRMVNVNEKEKIEPSKSITINDAFNEISQLIEEDLKSSDILSNQVSKVVQQPQVSSLKSEITDNDKLSKEIELKNNSEATTLLGNVVIQNSENLETSFYSKENVLSHPNKDNIVKSDADESCKNKIIDTRSPIHNISANDSVNPNEHNITKNETGKTCQNKIIDTTPILENESSTNELVVNNDAIVSTSEVNQSETVTELEENAKQTSDLMKKLEEDRLPDSTNEISNENISSTLKDDIKEKSSKNELDTFGNLLNILQDKTKIKQLLAMLGDQGTDNEKIKKKLEKISEIVSDDEDTKDGVKQSNDFEELQNTPLASSTENLDLLKCNKESLPTEDSKDSPSTSLSENDKEQNISEVSTEIKVSDQITSSQEISKDIALSPEKVTVTAKPKNKKSGKILKQKKPKDSVIKAKRITRSTATGKVKKKRGELQKLQDDIKEMFLSDDILNASGIRMCRLAKMLGEKTTPKEDPVLQDSGPKVVLEKITNKEVLEAFPQAEKTKKKTGPKSKIQDREQKLKSDNPAKGTHESNEAQMVSYRPGPKSKTKRPLSEETSDPYAFETESVNTSIASHENTSENSSDSENESLASVKSFASTEPLIDLKKKKRKRRGWRAGVIKSRNKKKKLVEKNPEININVKETSDNNMLETKILVPDLNCYTDIKYCFLKDVTTYSCRLCTYAGDDIVHHYKKDHPHSEVPLSRMHPAIAKKAIQQCEEVNFQTISKLPTEKYVCRFCFKEFAKKKNILEIFFWHIVSVHTGEYKQVCTECVNFRHCPFNLDIPPPPKDQKGQLIGYICDKCNFTQISLENLKLHVILRHNDDQTAVYTINLADMTEGTINELSKQLTKELESPKSRLLRNNLPSKTESSTTVTVENTPIITEEQCVSSQSYQTRISFENDDTSEVSRSFSEDFIPDVKDEPNVPLENEGSLLTKNSDSHSNNEQEIEEHSSRNSNADDIEEHNTPNDIVDTPHLKICYTETGSKEYLCCINGNMHYRTSLLISFRKHVQKHDECWDGYCCVCKVIVTPIGKNSFKQLLQHFIDNHMDSFPVENISPENSEASKKETSAVESVPKTYINVRPLAELLSTTSNDTEQMQSGAFPVIEQVISLGAETSVQPVVDPPQLSPDMHYGNQNTGNNIQFEPTKFEEAQAEIMSKKHRVVLETMITPDKLVRVFKCAGRFCSYSTDSTEEALVHALTHQRIGGENALKCAYCDFDSSGNAIDLVMHVFKVHAQSVFVCGHCFYRAAAPQLVGAHITRFHALPITSESVLKSTRSHPPVADDGLMRELKREEACLYYVCNNGGRNFTAACKFKTFTPAKFIDHFQQKHSTDNLYSCYLCSEDCSTPIDLVSHLKTHGLKRYQCLWCVFGAEDEPELLAHGSEKHPWKLPQGYIRIVTNKGASYEYRVLPKALLNKNKVPFTEIDPNTSVENPTREAERSVDLGKLIGNLLIDSTNLSTQNVIGTSIIEAPEKAAFEKFVQEKTSPHGLRVTNPPTTEDNVPTLKTENVETPRKNDEVICLDSDEDDAPAQVKLSTNKLFKCMKCKSICKTYNGFKRHLNHCYGTSNPDIICYHCSKKVKSAADLLVHLVSEHSIGDKYCCSICNHQCKSINALKKHMKQIHLIDKPTIKTQYKDNQFTNYAMGQSKAKVSKTPTKQIKYGPQDISALPINPILEELVYCALCEFNTKVRLNMVRHLQLHAEQQPVAQTAPVNPVPHLETNEKYFDKMLNLASSSISINKSKKPETVPSTQVIPPEAAVRYPKFIPDRQRFACGAKGCSYISVDEGMFKCHWETLHNGVNEFTCLHCPPHQHLDPNIHLNAQRIINHLKMHDTCLYACSSCPYYHFRLQLLEKHINENHSAKGSQVVIIRDENTTSPQTPPANALTSQAPTAPTMDLKPWQCGLCQFKSMLRQEINDHCSKVHQSKMQYKCSHCPFRASTLDNVNKHQKNSHPDKDADIFYFYYREDAIPNDTDGTPRWLKQRQKAGISETEVKTETLDPSKPSESDKLETPTSIISIPTVDLNIVKQELNNESDHSLESLCVRFGQFCEPNGIKYKCPLCNIVSLDTKEAMQSHLYEELRYRKWACSICAYKAFHRTGLADHMASEHKYINIKDPVELPKDVDIEVWVSKLLDHQTHSIQKNKEKLYAQHIKTPVETPKREFIENSTITPPAVDRKMYDAKELEQAFGEFGVPDKKQFACPKCQFKTGDAAVMQDHLESELNKIRWSCQCSKHFQTYHEAQFHCRSAHLGLSVRPIEALRNPDVRAAWVFSVIASQKSSMNCLTENDPSTSGSMHQLTDIPDAFENSLLAVRYEERVPTPELTLKHQRQHQYHQRPANDYDAFENSLLAVRYEERVPTPELTLKHERQHQHLQRPANDYESEDEKSVIVEPSTSESTTAGDSTKHQRACPHCNFKGHYSAHHHHLVQHYDLKPISCTYCDFMGYKSQVLFHLSTVHRNLPKRFKNTPIPPGPPVYKDLLDKKKQDEKNASEDSKLLCLTCEKQVVESEKMTHKHNDTCDQFAKKDDCVVKCGECLNLYKSFALFEQHFAQVHEFKELSFAYFQIKTTESYIREVLRCGHCDKSFVDINYLRNHHKAEHCSLPINFSTEIVTSQAESTEGTLKRKSSDPTSAPTSRKTARKSTTKLPKVVARKSTTKLPLTIQTTENDSGEFSFYGTKTNPIDKYENVTTLMPFYNTMMTFKLKQLSEILNINPKVLVEDLNK